MRKHLVRNNPSNQPPNEAWLNLERVAQAEFTSEDTAHPIESALLLENGAGWRAAEPGTQTIRILFDEPQHLRRIWLCFLEPTTERTQEFALRWSADGGRSFRNVLRQQYTFSPMGAISEIEDLHVDLCEVTTLELTIVPDQGREQAHASLAQWRLA